MTLQHIAEYATRLSLTQLLSGTSRFMHDPSTSIHDLPDRDRELVRQCLAGMSLGRGPIGWYPFASTGTEWIARLLVSQGFAATTRDAHGPAYEITPLGSEFNQQLIAKYGVYTFPEPPTDTSTEPER